MTEVKVKEGKKPKGNFCDRIMKNLIQDKTEVVVVFNDGTDEEGHEEIKGKIKGVGQYTFVLDATDRQIGTLLIFKHSVKFVMPSDSKVKLKW